MIFQTFSNLDGKHAPFSASQPYWLNDDEKDIVKRFRSMYASQIGTVLHEFARKRIKYGMKLTKADKRAAIIDILEEGIPKSVVYGLDMDFIFENIQNYVNDAITYRMSPEVHLYFSDNFFGTTDAIAFNEKEKKLRIADLKTGTGNPNAEQLIVYAALFCLQYNKDPESIDIDLNFYHKTDLVEVEVAPNDISNAMNKIVTFDEIIRKERG